ncbi:MAG TPA: hypothetical protein ENG51_13610 [Deltaproteobacteria bacterium]|nr:hypothetical protein [Deltaproteobacteria bacterium]
MEKVLVYDCAKHETRIEERDIKLPEFEEPEPPEFQKKLEKVIQDVEKIKEIVRKLHPEITL